MAKQYISVRVSAPGINDVLRKFREMPDNARDELRSEAQKLAEKLASDIRNDGRADAAPQSAIVSSTVNVVEGGLLPTIEVGGQQRIGRRGTPAYKLLFGSVFGSDAYRQFHRHHNGRDGYWVFPTVDRNGAEIVKAWNQAAENVAQKFAEG